MFGSKTPGATLMGQITIFISCTTETEDIKKIHFRSKERGGGVNLNLNLFLTTDIFKVIKPKKELIFFFYKPHYLNK